MRLPIDTGDSEASEFDGSRQNQFGYPQFLDNNASTRPLWMRDVQLLTVNEVAGLLGIGRSTVYELLYKGELRSVKIGGSRRIRYSDLGEYVRYLDDAS